MAPKKKPALDVAVAVDPKLKKRWDTLSKAIAAAVARDASAFDERWEAAAKIVEHEPPLYVLGGYASASQFYREALRENVRNATRFMRVARFASPAEETRYGVHKLDRALGWLEAKSGAPLGRALPTPLAKLRIAVVRDGKTRALPLTELSVADIDAATKALLAKAGKAPAKRTSHAQRAVAEAVRKARGLGAVTVRESGGLLHLGAIPVASWESFRAAIAGLKLDELVSAPRPAATAAPKPAKRASRRPT